MYRLRYSRHLPVLSCLLLLTAVGGCDRSEQAGDDTKTNNNNAAQPADKPVDPQPDKKPVPPLDTVPQTADAAVQAVIDGLKSNNPRAVWDFLPAGYQRDVTGLVHTFAAKMDVELWNHSFQTTGRLMVLLKTKKKLLLKSPTLRSIGPIVIDMEQNWDPAIEFVTTLMESDIADLKKLRTIDVGLFLKTTGSRLFTQLAALSTSRPDEARESFIAKELSGVRAQLDTSKKSTDTTAWILLTPPAGKGEPESIQFVRVEGKWIPKPLADGWGKTMAFLRLQLEKVTPEDIAEKKRDITIKLDEVDRIILALQKTQTEQEFNKQLALLLPTVFKVRSPLAVDTGPADPLIPNTDPVATDPKAAVIIIIHAKLDEKQEDVLCEQLMGLVDNKNLALAGVPVFRRGITTIKIEPVADVAAFARKIKFAEVVDVDLENRAVLIKLTPPAKSK